MEKDSALYQLMDTRMHSVMNGIVSSDSIQKTASRRSGRQRRKLLIRFHSA